MNLPIRKITFSFFAMLIAVSAYASQANADIYNRIDRQALRIQAKSKQLLRETTHYRYTPQYRQMVACTTKLVRLSAHIHDVTQFEGNLAHLRNDLRQLDFEFHQLESLFDRVELTAGQGCSRIQGNTRHVKVLLNAIEDCIHHIREDVEELSRFTSYQAPVVLDRPIYQPRPTYIPTRSPYGVGWDRPIQSVYGFDNRYDTGFGPRTCNGGGGSSFGFSIGGGTSQLHFRF